MKDSELRDRIRAMEADAFGAFVYFARDKTTPDKAVRDLILQKKRELDKFIETHIEPDKGD